MTNKDLFSRLLKKAVSMTLCTKAITCDKAGFKSRFCQEHQAGKYKISVNPVILSNFSSCSSCASWLKNLFNQRNPWLINDLRACKTLYNCRETFTDVMSALQIKLFMQNKAKFRKSQMIVTKVLTKDYEKKTLGEHGKKQSQTNPNKAKFKKAKMNVTSYITKAYENILPIRVPKKQSQISKQQKPMQTSLPQRIMKIIAFSGSDKTNPIQTQTNPTCSELACPACPERSRRERSRRGRTYFRGKKMLNLTINARRKSFGYYADEIEAANAYDRPAENHLSSTCGSVVGLSFIGNQIGEQVGQPPQIKKVLDFSCFFNHSIAHRDS